MKKAILASVFILIVGIISVFDFSSQTKANKENLESSKKVKVVNSNSVEAPLQNKKSLNQIKHDTMSTPAVTNNSEVPEYLEEFYSLNSKVLKTSSELLRYRSILSETRNIRKSVLTLLEFQEKEEVKKKMPIRIHSSNFLASALAWEANPQREFVIEAIKSLLIYKELTEDKNDLKKARTGDKVELYSALYIYAPEAAEEVKKLSQGTKLFDLLTFAESLFHLQDQRRQYEEKK